MSVDYSRIKSEIGYFIGTPESKWDSNTSTAVEHCIRTGIDKVVHNGIHQWTWMRPRWEWKTSDGQRRYTLPLDFEQFIPNEIYYNRDDASYGTITHRPAPRLMQLQGSVSSTGKPVHFAIEPLPHDGATEQQQQLVLQPTPDSDYELVAVYQIGVRTMTNDRPYPPGGPEHGELFIASCVAATEAKFRDGETEKQQAFKEALVAHIAIDLRKQPRNLGMMGGRAGRVRGRSSLRGVIDLVDGYTTYNGGTEI